ncbi:hypothetical protein JYT30_00595 [Desulfotalea psychrophila]|nr:hypothetical protein [Desulfotalea psychrophila]
MVLRSASCYYSRKDGRRSKMKNSVQTGSIIGGVGFILVIILVFWFFGESGVEVLETDTISWAAAVEKCKVKYKSQRPAGLIKVSNCRKRLWDDEYFYFYWSKPQSIFIKKSTGEQVRYDGTCQVERKTGEIVYMTLNDRELVKKIRK